MKNKRNKLFIPILLLLLVFSLLEIKFGAEGKIIPEALAAAGVSMTVLAGCIAVIDHSHKKSGKENTDHNKKFKKHAEFPFIADLYNIRDNNSCDILIVNIEETDGGTVVYFIADPDNISCSICNRI